MKKNYRNLFMVGVMALAAAFTGCKEEVLPELSTAVNSSEEIAAEVRSTSASFTLNTKDVNNVAYFVKAGVWQESEFNADVIYSDAAANGRLVAVKDGKNTINIYGLEGGTEYTAFFAYLCGDEYALKSQVFTTPSYDRVITVVESKKDGFKFHIEVPDTMKYMYAFLQTEWYNSARLQFMYNDLIFLMDGKLMEGPQTIEINNGDYWNEDYDPEWDSPWYIHPGSAYTVLMGECDADGNLLYEENTNYEDPWGGDVWGPLAPATRAGVTDEPRVGFYTEEVWSNDDMYPTGLYARQNLLAALQMVDSKINVELVGKTERRIKVRCTTDEETQYIIAPMMKAQYDEFVTLVSEEAVASTLLEYYGADVYSGTQDFEFDENSIWVELDSTYVIGVVGVYNDDASVISYDTLHVTLTKSTMPAAEVEITAVENAETPNLVWFNIKSVGENPVYAAKHIANYTKEVQKMINDGNTYEDLLNSYGAYLTEEDVQAINSEEGLTLSIVSMDDTESTLIIGAFNEEEGLAVYTGKSRSAEMPALERVNSTLFEDLKGDWTARIIQQKSEYSWETFEYTYYVDTTYTTLTLGYDFNEQTPASFDASHEAYDAVFSSYVESALEKGYTEEEAADYAAKQVEKYFNDYKAMAQKYSDKYYNQNYIVGVGFEDAHTYASPWDLFCATNYTAYDVEELFYAYGPKLFFQVQQDGSLALLGDANIMTLAPVAAWGYYEYVMVGNNPLDENIYYNGGFPVEVVDADTLVIKGVTEDEQNYYPALGYWAWGWLSYSYQTIADIQLTRGVAVEDEVVEDEEVVEPTEAAKKVAARANNRIKRTYLPTEVIKTKTTEMPYVNVLENVQAKFNKYNARLNK